MDIARNLHQLRFLPTRVAVARLFCLTWLGGLCCCAGGCATIRVTDPPRTADEEFLLTQAADQAVSQLSLDALRGRGVWVVSEYAFSTTQPYEQSFLTDQVRVPQFENAYLIAALRARLLQLGARLPPSRDQSDVILEVRTGALSINRIDFLLGLSAFAVPSTGGSTSNALSFVSTSNLALFQNIKQQGFASVAVVAYWRNTGELLALSGPFIGRTFRYDYFILGYALPAVGNIPPTQAGSGK
jgi:hypothetical protein